MFNNKSILITGGTGTLGKELVRKLLANYPDIKRLVIFSRDEQKQFQMSKQYPEKTYPCLRYFIGDIRDFERLKRALKNIDYVIHAAAMKHVHIAEYNPIECVKTNVLGAENLINASIECGVKKVVALSTDKAAAPVNLYGATKLTSDKLFIAANNIRGRRDINFSVVRYGNVMGSNGSVIPFFLREREKGILPITDPEMTRFNISIEEGADLVFYAMKNAWGGEIFVPKLYSYNILDLAKAIGPDCKYNIVGIRPGEKIHEEMITKSDSDSTYQIDNHYVILPQKPAWDLNKFIAEKKAVKVPKGFSYDSGTNKEFLTVSQINKLVNTLNLQ